jgi:hypothetical protein
MGAIRIHAATG